jgi:hypothetical protein
MNVAFLLDADNLSSASDVDQVFGHFRGAGVMVTVRRAYGGTDKLMGLRDVLKKHAMRSFVNQGKGTTDAALVVDAMDLLHHGALPEMVALGSSDADFAPLAVRLREAGIRVVCFALREKADAEALALVYDDVVYLDAPARSQQQPQREAPARPAAKRPPAAKKAAPPPAAAPAPARAPAAKSPAAKAPAARKTASKSALPALAAADILKSAPALLSGEAVPLNEVTKRLRDEKVLGKSAKSTTLLGRFPQDFRLEPKGSPSHVQWIGQQRR